jgi:hypothetical protein
MKKVGFTIILLFSLLGIVGIAYGSIPFVPRTYLQPMSGTNAYILSGTNASQIVSICGVDENVFLKHWHPSEEQVRIIDEKLNLKLENIDDNTGLYKIIKLYFGLEDLKNKKYVYTFIFPTSKGNGITLDFWNDSLICPRLKSIAEFSLDKLELRMLKPDITNAFNGWRIKPRHN